MEAPLEGEYPDDTSPEVGELVRSSAAEDGLGALLAEQGALEAAADGSDGGRGGREGCRVFTFRS